MRQRTVIAALLVMAAVCGVLIFLGKGQERAMLQGEQGQPSQESIALPAETVQPESGGGETAYVYHPAVPILMYHQVSEECPNDLYLSTADFQSHLAYFAEAGITPVTMEQLWSHWTAQTPLPEKPIVLTFDDGYRNMYNVVYPLLREYGWPGTFFCISEAVWSEDFLLESMITEMAAGGMEIGSHTKSHVELDGYSGDALMEQLSVSKSELSALTGGEVAQLCYPAGQYNSETVSAAEQAGYHCAVTTDYGFAAPEQGLYQLSRIRVNTGDNGETLRSILSRIGY